VTEEDELNAFLAEVEPELKKTDSELFTTVGVAKSNPEPSPPPTLPPPKISPPSSTPILQEPARPASSESPKIKAPSGTQKPNPNSLTSTPEKPKPVNREKERDEPRSFEEVLSQVKRLSQKVGILGRGINLFCLSLLRSKRWNRRPTPTRFGRPIPCPGSRRPDISGKSERVPRNPRKKGTEGCGTLESYFQRAPFRWSSACEDPFPFLPSLTF